MTQWNNFGTELFEMIAELILCASLTAVDGDTVKCDGKNMRLLGEGVAFVSGVDTPVIGSHAKCVKERKLALIAEGWLKELLTERASGIESSSAVARRSRTGRSSTSNE